MTPNIRSHSVIRIIQLWRVHRTLTKYIRTVQCGRDWPRATHDARTTTGRQRKARRDGEAEGEERERRRQGGGEREREREEKDQTRGRDRTRQRHATDTKRPPAPTSDLTPAVADADQHWTEDH